MSRKTIVYKQKDSIYLFDADEKETGKKHSVYHNLSNDYNAANITGKSLRLLGEKTHNAGKVIEVIDYVPHKLEIYGFEQYRGGTSVCIRGLNDTKIDTTIDFPDETCKAKIVINDAIIEYNSTNEITSEIISQGNTSIFIPFGNTKYFIGFKDKINKIQLRQDYL